MEGWDDVTCEGFGLIEGDGYAVEGHGIAIARDGWDG